MLAAMATPPSANDIRAAPALTGPYRLLSVCVAPSGTLATTPLAFSV